MKKWCIVIVMLAVTLLFTFNLDAQANSFREVKIVSGSALIVKSSASPTAKTVGSLKRGDFVTIYTEQNGWSMIQAGATKGYVVSSFLSYPSSIIKIASSKGGLVVKESASRSAKTVATLQYNMVVEDYGTVNGGWNFVQYGNVTGYVASTFIGVPKTIAKSTKEELFVRNIASKSGDVLYTLDGGTQVSVHSTLAGWTYISNGAIRGYVEAAKLVDVKPMTTAYAKDYLPMCPKWYTFVESFDFNDELDLQYVHYECIKQGNKLFMLGEEQSDAHVYSIDGTALKIEFDEEVYQFAFPLTANKKWTMGTGEDKRAYEVVDLNATFTMESGVYFNVIKVKETTNEYETFYYLAPKLGLINITTESKMPPYYHYGNELFRID